MTGLCGYFGVAGLDPSVQLEMSEALTRFDASSAASLSDGNAWLALAAHANRYALVQEGATLLALYGHPRYENEPSSAETLARRFIQAYRQEGIPALLRLRGDFALALVDLAKRETVLAIDRAAVCSLAYTENAKSIVFGTTADAVKAALPERALDPQAIFDYLYFHMIPAPQTIYGGIRRLGPGECVVYRNGKAQVSRYWELHYEEHQTERFEVLRERLHRTLQHAVAVASADADTGCFLSGGTDSSTLAGMLGKVGAGPARTYSIGFAAQGYDEMEYARIASRHFGTEQHEYYVTPDDIVAAVPKIAQIYDQPFGNSSAVPTYYCARLAKQDGRARLLGGDGGDELFGGNARYATQAIFEIYSKVPPALRATFEPLLNGMPIAGKLALVRKARSYVAQASMAMPARYESYNLLEHFGVDQVLHSDFRGAVEPGAPLRQMTRVYQRNSADSLINRMLALDFKYTLADNDLPKVTRMCELAGIDVVFPMLDDSIIDFSCTLGPELKLKRTQLRYFFKKSMRGFLPDEILKKSKHGFGLPFGVWAREHAPLRELVNDSLVALKTRRIIAPKFIDELVDRKLHEHAAYYGTMIWILMMLEQWLQAHPSDL